MHHKKACDFKLLTTDYGLASCDFFKQMVKSKDERKHVLWSVVQMKILSLFYVSVTACYIMSWTEYFKGLSF